MSGIFSGRVAFCTLEIDGGAGTAVITNQSGDFVEAPALPIPPIYTAAGDYLLTLKSGFGIDPNEGIYLVSAGEGTNVAGLPVVFAAADQTIQIQFQSGGGGTVDPSLAGVARLHLVVLLKPQN